MVEITAATAIGWVVSPVIKMVITRIGTFIEKKYFKKSGIENDMKKMKMTLGDIQLIMATVEKQRILNPNKEQLVREIKDAVYDAEDIVDEFEYNLLNEKSEKQKNKVIHVATALPRAIRKKNLKEKVKEVGKGLDRAKDSANTLLQLMDAENSCNLQYPKQENWSSTSSFAIDEIIGRENERKLLMDLLFEKVEGPPTIIAIIGHGGIGKTSLAQMVVNDPRVSGHFDKLMWLFVSDNFDKVEFTKQMLKDICENFSSTGASFNTLQKKLERELASKKILLVLDDVWYVKDDTKKYIYEKSWSEFLAPLKSAKAGSKIVVTTQQYLVTCTLEYFGSVRSIPLDGLNDADSWSLFKLNAFDGKSLDNLKDLEAIGKAIVEKLKGLALAIKVVGRELRGKPDIEQWKRILNDNSLDNNGIMEILCRSYEHLPEHLQRCFSYCSLFPKGYYLKPDRLVHMWIANGFVHLQKEDDGKSYFNELVVRSFIQVIKRDNKENYVMHDLMNDLACHVSKGECYMLKNGDSMKNLGSIRHLSATPSGFNLIKDISGFHKLRTLIFLSRTWFPKNNFIDEVLIKLKRIRVLDIDWVLNSVPNVSGCKHLRYLCFRNNNYKFASDSFSKLHHLAMLYIRKNLFDVEVGDNDHLKLPKSIYLMSRLVFIHISKSFTVDVGQRVKLQSLLREGSVYVHVKNKEALELGLLHDVNNIKGCVEIVGLENVHSKENAIQAQLSSKKYVTELRLRWFNSSSKVKSNKNSAQLGGKEHDVLEALEPNRNTERLKIRGYPGDLICPSWLEPNLLSQIKSVELEECNGLKMLPALGQLPHLKELRIAHMNIVSIIGNEFYGNGLFPSLKELEIVSMRSLEEWSFPCETQSFPKLYKLRIFNCPRFVVPEWARFPSLRSLTKIHISDCKRIITLEGLNELVTLKILSIRLCPNLLSLPEMELLYSLEKLVIRNCTKLRSLPKRGLPVSLQELIIMEAHHKLEAQIHKKNGREWDKVAAISGCRCLIYCDGDWHMVQESHTRGPRYTWCGTRIVT